ncbi:MAG: oligopeptide transporter, OPT family [Acidobacteriota bacterium]
MTTLPKPYISPATALRDLTLRAAFAGILFGAIFGSANAYLGLKVGLTVSTSIPLAVISVAIFKIVGRLFRPSNILECNISQTGGSAASSIASGLIFTIPGLFMWGLEPSLLQVGTLAVAGAGLGILLMIPLRRYLIVQEHAELPYPEGTAAAQVLIAADSGGARARSVFIGMAVGGLYKFLLEFGRLWSSELHLRLPLLKKGEIGIEPMPALLGVGYILGYRIGAIMVAGGLLSSLALIPLIAHFGENLTSPLFPETDRLIREMSPGEIWSRYIRYIGAGAVACAGILTVIRSLPTMYNSLVDGLRGFRRRNLERPAVLRTERDLPMTVVAAGVVLVFLITTLTPFALGLGAPSVARVLGSILILVFAFVFVTVSSRIVGLVGVTSNPTSGMAIVTLLGASLIFFALGWTDLTGQATVLTIGTVVCVAASIAGDISQDLKCGFLIGATPAKQQTVELIGAVTAAFAVAAAVLLLGESFTFGSRDLPAPQATLMKTVIEGVMQANLPWGLVAAGAALSIVAALLGVPALPFAVGIYLPLSSMTPVFLGGCLRRLVDRRRPDTASAGERETERGVLVGSGLIAGEGLMGIAVAAYAAVTGSRPAGWGLGISDGIQDFFALTALAAILLFLWRSARDHA